MCVLSVCVCVCVHACVCVGKPVAFELRCHATALFIPPMYKICEYEVKFTGMIFYLEKVIGQNGHGPK